MAEWKPVEDPTATEGTPPAGSWTPVDAKGEDNWAAKSSPSFMDKLLKDRRTTQTPSRIHPAAGGDMVKGFGSGLADAAIGAVTFLPDLAGQASAYTTEQIMDLAQGEPAGQVAKRVGGDAARKVIETALLPIELGAQGGTAIGNKITGQDQPGVSPTASITAALGLPEYSVSKVPRVPTLNERATKALGVEYEPKTTEGKGAKLLGEFGLPAIGVLSAPARVAAAENLGKLGTRAAETIEKVRERIKFAPPAVVNEDTKAAAQIMAQLTDLHKAGGEAPDAVVKMIKEARSAGTPLSLADVNEGTQRKAGTVYRQGGVGREVIKQHLEARDAAAEQRLSKSLNKYLGSGSVRQTIDDTAAARSKAARPLFDEAMRGGSIAPLEKQYETEFNIASQNVAEHSAEVSKILNRVTQLKGKLATNKDIYVGAETAKEIRAAEGQLLVKEIELKQAQEDKGLVLEHLRTAQSDRASGTPGAVWSPQIQRLAQNPHVKAGLGKGMSIECNFADAEGRTFDPREYATATNAKGELEVARVPNMRVLAVAKEGLDSLLASPEMRDPVTRRLTKEGLSIQKVRDSLVSELDRINKDYPKARDVWAGESAKINAVNFGQDAFTAHPEDIIKGLDKMNSSEREFARLGLAEKMRENLLKTRLNGDEAKKLINNEWTKKQIRPFFRNDAEFNAFVKDVSTERTMFETGVTIARNSLTADRQAADMADKLKTGVQAGKGALDLVGGAYHRAADLAISLWQKSQKDSPEFNEAIARLLFDPNADMSHLEKLATAPKGVK